MTETHTNGASPPSPGLGGRHAIATSLFGGAILASVATASLGQSVYVPSIVSLGTMTIPSDTFVVAGGNNFSGDGGGGVFVPGGTVCSPDNGIVFQDHTFTCFYRADPTYSVREWGALCDVVVVNPPGGTLSAMWNPGGAVSMNGTLTVPTSLLPTPLVVTAETVPSVFIAISQIGSPTLFGSSLPAVSLTRFSTLSNTGAGYSKGDLVSFAGGTFSQQVAIIVDAVASGGTITQWHVLWGGLYQPGSVPPGPMMQDSSRTYCGTVSSGGGTITYTACGVSGHAVGATLTPAWSGWSVLNSQSITAAGTNYSAGDIVTLSATGDVANQGQYPTLVVENVNGTGGVTAYDWLDYGSFGTLANTGTLADNTALVGPTNPHGLTFGSVAWTQGPYASTIVSAGTVGTTGMSTIVVAGMAAFPGTLAVQSFYYGTDDSIAINKALNAMPASALVIPAGCGTTARLNLAQGSAANNDVASLVGSNLESSGLYAFLVPPALRSDVPVLGSVLYAGLTMSSVPPTFISTSGGGFRNLLVEGFGIPEGYGYWGLAEGATAPSGYVGPSSAIVDFNIPSAGTAVELDRALLMRIDNVHVTDGGMGPGNATMQIGVGDSDPAHVLGIDVGTIVFTDSRMDSNPLFFAGPSNPDFALNMGSHDSVYRNLTANDAITADVVSPGGDLFSQIHVGSSTINATIAGGPAPAIDWSTASITNFGFAGVANYGVYVSGNTSLSQTRCQIANTACIFTAADPNESGASPGQITDTQIGCAAFTSVPAGYGGVLISANTLDVTVGGTAAAGKCAMPPAQLVTLLQGGPLDPSSSLCNNSNAPVAACTGYQGGFAALQSYTQPAVAYTTSVALSVSPSASTLYAVPFYSPAGGGTITELGLQVTVQGAVMTTCDLGVYNAFAGRPTSLIANSGGAVGVATIGPVTTAGALSVEVAPATLYFLAVGCNGAVTVEGVASGGGLTVPLTGAPDLTTTTTGLTSTFTFASGLPPNFGATTITPGGPVPNVYASRLSLSPMSRPDIKASLHQPAGRTIR